MKRYTDEDVDDLVDFWHTRNHSHDGVLIALDDAARVWLDQHAPAIAARALREAAQERGERGYTYDAFTRNWLRARADKIEAQP